MECKTCVWWQDYKIRVYACISNGHSDIVRDRIELRLCKYNLPPQIDSNPRIYTDENYCCSAYTKIEKGE